MSRPLALAPVLGCIRDDRDWLVVIVAPAAPRDRPASSTRRRPSASARSRKRGSSGSWSGRAGRVRPHPKTIRVAEDCLRYLAPLNDLAVERIRRPPVEDLLADIASHAPRRAEMAFSLVKRILMAAEDRRQQVDRAIYGIRIARADEREPRFLTWEEADELRSWMPEYVARIAPVGVLTMLRRGEILGLRDRDTD